jgi:tripartite-type tricarboxylate transporter receptor subunit TctC
MNPKKAFHREGRQGREGKQSASLVIKITNLVIASGFRLGIDSLGVLRVLGGSSVGIRMRRSLLGWTVAVWCCTPQWGAAQQYPAKPLRLIVPWTAGSGTDLMSRMIAQKLGETLGQQVVVDNRGGAGATIGTEAAARAAPDGYTLYIGGSVSMAISPVLYRKVAYDPVKDFAPVSLVSRFYNVLSVHPSVPVKSVKELIALARARPGQLVMASAGAGSTSHLAGELFKHMAKVDMLHVPYKGGGQMVIAVISGEGHVMFSPVSTATPHGKTGKLRLLGVSSPARIAPLPDLPTISETVPGYEFGGWQGLLVPAGTAQDIINRLHAAVLKSINTPEFKDYVASEGSELVGSTPGQFAQFIRSEVVKHASLVKASGARPE